MRAVAIFVLGTAVGCAAWACSAVEDDSEAGESGFTGDNVVTVATCSIAKVPEDRSTMVAPYTPEVTPHFANTVPDAQHIVTKFELTMKVIADGEKRKIESLTGTAVTPAGTVTVNFLPTNGKFTTGTERPYQSHTLMLDPTTNESSAIMLGRTPLKVSHLLLHWEGTGQGWVMIGNLAREADAGADAPFAETRLMATAPSCTFDVGAWNLLRDPSCEDDIYADAGARPECHTVPFAKPPAAEVPDAAPDADPPVDPPPPPPPPPVDPPPPPPPPPVDPPPPVVVDAGVDAGPAAKPDAGKPSGGGSTKDASAKGPHETGADFPEDDRFGPAEPASADSADKPGKKLPPKVRAAESDCSFSPGKTTSGGAPAAAIFAALALVAARRRRSNASA